jgi:Uncharacterized protein conserved in bacteria
MILMVIRLFDRHSIFVCVCIMAVVIAITMAFNLGSKNRTAPNSESSQPVSSETESAGSASSFLSESFGNFSRPVSENAGASAAEPSSGAAVSSQAAAVSAAVSGEMRAVWVPYMSLDMSHEADKSEKAFQKKFDAIIANAKKCNMNTLIVHVRPFGDALYKSSYYPWSHTVGGTQGVNPGYDPLAYMVSASHKAGLKIHAWINPLRVQIASTPSILAQENPYNTWIGDTSKTGWVVESGSGKYYNPAYTQVRRLIADGAKEIAKNYGVDGIQFDDYFYPTQDAAFDKTAYEDYYTSAQKSGTPLSLQEWRRANVNALVSLVYSEIKSAKPGVVFGIAPQGNVQNDLNLGADVISWCGTQGYVDYICPQLYVNFENPVLPYGTAVQNWRKLVTNKNIKLYFGLAVYKAGSDADSGTWKKSDTILAQQVSLGRKTPCDGFMFYSSDYLSSSQTKEEIQNVMKVLN